MGGHAAAAWGGGAVRRGGARVRRRRARARPARTVCTLSAFVACVQSSCIEPSELISSFASSRAMSSVSACASRSAFSLSTSVLHWRSSFESSVTSWPTSADLPSSHVRSLKRRSWLRCSVCFRCFCHARWRRKSAWIASSRFFSAARSSSSCVYFVSVERSSSTFSARPLSSGARFGWGAEVGRPRLMAVVANCGGGRRNSTARARGWVEAVSCVVGPAELAPRSSAAQLDPASSADNLLLAAVSGPF